MDLDEYRRRGKEMVDYIADYLETIRQRRVFPNVKPGYMRSLVPDAAPEEGEQWHNIFSDVERVIMPGITHWQSPYMHAYFPALNSCPSLLGDMLADAIGCLGFTWASSPACTELETIVMDWLGKMIGLPTKFLHSNEQTMGGGVIQTTASEATFVSLLAARSEAIKRIKVIHPELEPAEINGRLVAYCSDQAHSSVEKASLVGLVKLRLLPTDADLSLRGETLRAAVDKDRTDGLIPFFLCATLGTTGACAFDKLAELGPICAEEEMWMHIDAAYAGTAFICPEFRHFMEGTEYAQSFAFNPSKWMMVHFDCTAMWTERTLLGGPRQNCEGMTSRVQNSGALHRTFNVQPLYLRHENTGAAIDYMHWQVPLSRRFRSLKLWFVLRNFGITGLQKHVREGIRLAKKFEHLVTSDPRFEVPAKCHLGLVVFRLQGENDLTELLLKRLNQSGKLHAVPASIKGKYIIRFTVTSTHTTDADIARDWGLIQAMARKVLVELGKEEDTPAEADSEDANIVSTLSNIGQMRREGMKRKEYGMSLILSNVPMSPKIINGSFAAMFDNSDIITEYARHLSRRSLDFNGRPIRLSPRKRLKEQSKQYSFDLTLIPAVRRYPKPQRQASLDSKIEEIFDTSLESEQDLAGEVDGRFSDGDQGEVSEEWGIEAGRIARKKFAEVETADKAVQSPTSPPYMSLPDSKTGSPADDVTIALATTPSRVNGLTPLLCKHCGNPVEG